MLDINLRWIRVKKIAAFGNDNVTFGSAMTSNELLLIKVQHKEDFTANCYQRARMGEGVMSKRGDDTLPTFTEVLVILPFLEQKTGRKIQ